MSYLVCTFTFMAKQKLPASEIKSARINLKVHPTLKEKAVNKARSLNRNLSNYIETVIGDDLEKDDELKDWLDS